MKFIRKEVLSVKEVYKQISFNVFPKGIFVGDIYEDDYNKEIVKIGNSYFSLEEHFEKVKKSRFRLSPLEMFLFCICKKKENLGWTSNGYSMCWAGNWTGNWKMG